MKKTFTINKPWLFVKSALLLLLCWLASFVIVMFFPMCYQKFGIVMCFIFGICSVGASVCIYGDSMLKLGKNMRISDERSGADNSKFGLLMGLVPTVINYMPLTYIVAPNEAVVVDGVVQSVNVPATELSIGAMILVTILPIIFLITCHVAYTIAYKRVDVKSKILYGK